MTADFVLHLLARFVHIACVIMFLGGVMYARQVLVPVLNVLPEDVRMQSAAGTQIRYRTTLYVLLTLIVASGLYNFLTFTGPKHSQAYQIWFGVEILLVAHIAGTGMLWATSPYGDVTVAAKSKHRLTSMAISGLAIVLISAYLRSLTLSGL